MGYILRRQGKHEEGLRRSSKRLRSIRETLTRSPNSDQLRNLRRYAQETVVLDGRVRSCLRTSLSPAPGLLSISKRGNPDPLCQFIEQLRRERPASLSDVADPWLLCTLVNHDWAAAEQAVAVRPQEGWKDGVVRLPRHIWRRSAGALQGR